MFPTNSLLFRPIPASAFQKHRAGLQGKIDLHPPVYHTPLPLLNRGRIHTIGTATEPEGVSHVQKGLYRKQSGRGAECVWGLHEPCSRRYKRFAKALLNRQTRRNRTQLTAAIEPTTKGERIMSDYYIKGTTKAGEPVTLPIEPDSVYTHCPDCGREHTVDIVDLAAAGDFDLYGSAIYCHECADKRRRAAPNT